MEKKNKQYRPRVWSASERRLCFRGEKNGPENFDSTAKDANEKAKNQIDSAKEQEKKFEVNTQIEKDNTLFRDILRDVIRKEGNPKMLEMFNDPMHQKRLIAFVKKRAHTINFLPENAAGLSRLQDKKFENPQERATAYKKSLESSVTSSIAYISDAIKQINEAQLDYPSPNDIDYKDIKNLLEQMGTRDLLQRRQEALVDIAEDVFSADTKEEMQKNIDSAFNKQEKIFQELTKDPGMSSLKTDIEEILNNTERMDDVKTKLKERLSTAANIGYSKDAINSLKNNVSVINRQLADLQEEEELHMQEVFKKQSVYLNQLGNNPSAMISGAMLQDGRFSLSLFRKTLGILNKNITDEEIKEKAKIRSASTIEIKDSVKEKILAMGLSEVEARQIVFTIITNGLAKVRSTEEWSKALQTTDEQNVEKVFANAWDTKALETYLKDDLHLSKNIPSYFRGAYLHSVFPSDVSDFLIKSEMPVSAGDLVAIAGIEKLTEANGSELTSSAKGDIFDLIAKNESPNGVSTPKFTIQKNRFIEVLSVLCIDKSKRENESAIAADAKTSANELWNSFADDAALEKVTAEDLRERFMNLSIVAAKDSVSFHQKMRHENVQNVSWASNIKEYAGTLFADSKVATKKWGDYMMNFTNILTDDGDTQLREMLNKRRGLQTLKKVIEEGITLSDTSGKKKMEDILTQMQGFHDREKSITNGLDTTGAATTSKEFHEHARMLANGYYYSLEELRSTSAIDTLDPSIQSIAMWTALTKTDPNNPDNSKYGLEESKKFIIEFTTAPNQLQRMREAHEAFMGRKILPEGVGQTPKMTQYYIDCVTRYQAIAQVETKVFDTYINAIKACPTSKDEQERLANNTILQHAMNAYKKEVDIFEKKKPALTDPDLYNRQAFIEGYYKKLSKEDTEALQDFNRKIQIQKENERTDNLVWLWNKHLLSVQPVSLQKLAQTRLDPTAKNGQGTDMESGSNSIDSWLNGDNLEAAEEPLRLVVNGMVNPEGKEALIHAYIEKRDIRYKMRDGTERIMTVQDALRAVKDIRDRLLSQSEDYPISKQLSEDYMRHFRNPLERGLRAGIETMQELWSGDIVDKLQLATALGVGIWLVKQAWKKGGKKESAGFWKIAKMGLIGFPLLVTANSMYRRQTGRDILGEKMMFMSPRFRNSVLEQWRRRSVKLAPSRYTVLAHNAGIAAISELTDENDKISVESLDEWRRNVTGTDGSRDYSKKAPKNLNVSKIMAHLGVNGTKAEAYEVAFLAYDALCANVAVMHERSGSVDDQVLWGANYIKRTYVDFEGQQDDPELREKLVGMNFGMGQVLNAESKIASKNGKTVLSSAEWVAEMLKSGKEKVVQSGTQAVGYLGEKRRNISEFSGEVYDEGKEYIFDTSETIYEWFRTTLPKVTEVTTENFSHTYHAISDSLAAVGGTIVQRGPEVFEWTFDITNHGLVESKNVALNVYRMLLTNGVTGPVLESLESSFKNIFGIDISEATKTSEYLHELSEYSNTKKSLIDQIENISEGDQSYIGDRLDSWLSAILTDNTKPLVARKPNEAEKSLEERMNALTPTERLLHLENLKRQIFAHIIASRIVVVDRQGDSPTFNKVEGPFRIVWPNKGENFSERASADKKTGKIYDYILAHYNPVMVSALMGNQELLEGTLHRLAELEPDSMGGQFSSTLLDIGFGNLLGRPAAREYMQYEIAAYVGPFLERAQKEMDEKQFKQYRVYIDALVTNVMVETILESDKQPPDLKLTVKQAKDMLRHLFMRRGIAPNPEEVSKYGDILAHFSEKQVDKPDLLKKLLRNKRKSWLLLGAQIPASGEAQNEDFASEIDAIDPNEVNQIVEEELDKRASVKDVNRQLEALRALTDPKKIAIIHAKLEKFFKEIKSELPTKGREFDPETRKILMAIEAGLPSEKATDIHEFIEQTLQPFYETCNTEQLREISTLDMRDRDEGLQKMFNTIVVKRLKTIHTDIKEELKEKNLTEVDGQLNSDKVLAGKFKGWEEDLLELYHMSNQPIQPYTETISATHRITDAVSRMLEFVLYRGDHAKPDKNGNTYFDKYRAYLQNDRSKFAVPPEDKTWGESILGTNRVPKRMDLNIRDFGGNNNNQLDVIEDRISDIEKEM